MKKFLMIVAVAGASLTSMAQLTTRESDPNTYKLGAYPQAGDLSLMFAVANLSNFDEDDANQASNIASVNGLKSGDLITAKYYWKDDVAFRAGIKLQREVTGKSSFDSDSSNSLFTQDPNTFSLFGTPQEATSSKQVVRDWAVKLGIEKHFNSANFFDVYAGADLYLGFGKEKFETSTTTFSGTAATVNNNVGVSNVASLTSARGYTKVGVLPFIGVQMFVLDLPVSVGIEYGWDALWKFGGLWKNDVEVTQQDGGTTVGTFTTFAEESVSGTYYSENRPTSATVLPAGNVGVNGSSSTSMLNTNQNVKLLVNVYFGRGGSSSSDVVIE